MPDSPYRFFRCQKCEAACSFSDAASHIDKKGNLFYECDKCHAMHSEKQCKIEFRVDVYVDDDMSHIYCADNKFCCGLDFETCMEYENKEIWEEDLKKYKECCECNEYLFKLIDNKITKIRKQGEQP